jgi:hypothetical protein
MHLLNITILDQNDKPVTLRKLQELSILKPAFYGLKVLDAKLIVPFIKAHPYCTVIVKSTSDARAVPNKGEG